MRGRVNSVRRDTGELEIAHSYARFMLSIHSLLPFFVFNNFGGAENHISAEACMRTFQTITNFINIRTQSKQFSSHKMEIEMIKRVGISFSEYASALPLSGPTYRPGLPSSLRLRRRICPKSRRRQMHQILAMSLSPRTKKLRRGRKHQEGLQHLV